MDDECALQDAVRGHALTIVRTTLGIIFVMHGSQMVLGAFGGLGFQATAQMFQQMGMPLFLGYVVSLIEFLGGIALVFGALTRLAALGIFCVMVGAIVTVHWKNGFFASAQGYEYNLALIALSLALILEGGGPWALDRFWCKKSNRIS